MVVGMKDRKILEQICEDARNDVDFFREVLLHSGMSDRNVMQMYMIYKFKWDYGKEIMMDPGWDMTITQWVDRGYAKKFADVYKEDKTVRQIAAELKI
jgi:hypothetical protein